MARGRIRVLMVTDAGRRALQEDEDAESRRRAMAYLFAPFKWQRATDTDPAVLSIGTLRHDGAHD